MRLVDHRGAHPKDAVLFSSNALPMLRQATDDLSWLLGRGYNLRSVLRAVGERHALAERQREAVSRAACGGETAARRRALQRSAVEGELWLDGFNVVIISERVLGRGPVILGRDGAYRDIAGVHGSWRRSTETEPALAAVGRVLAERGITRARWLLDRPVANADRLAKLIRAHAASESASWVVELVDGVDRRLAESGAVVATSDGWIHDRCVGWFNVVADVVASVPGAWVVDLSLSGGATAELHGVKQ